MFPSCFSSSRFWRERSLSLNRNRLATRRCNPSKAHSRIPSISAHAGGVWPTSFGIDRIVYSVLLHSFKETDTKDYFKFAPSVAPVQVGIYPLVNKEGPREIAIEITDKLRESGFKVEYDVSGTIGKRYARADEIGIPLAITVDFDSLEDNKVTVRNRDSEAQERIAIDEIKDYLEEYYK